VARPMPVKAPVINITGLLMVLFLFLFLAIWRFLPAEHGRRSTGELGRRQRVLCSLIASVVKQVGSPGAGEKTL
jgi:hypothetical protein